MEPSPAPSEPPGAGAPAERLARRERRSRLRQAFGTKLLTTFALLLTLVTTLVLGAVGLLIRDTTRRVLERQLEEHLESVAALAAAELGQPGYARYLSRAAAVEPSATRDLARERLWEACQRLKADAHVSEVVLFTGTPELGVLASSEGNEEHVLASALSRVLTDNLAVERATRDAAPASSALYALEELGAEGETWRLYKSAYAPILAEESASSPVLVGVELPANFTEAVDEVNHSVMALGALAGLIVLLAAVFLVRQRVHIPVFRLVRAMQGEDGRPTRARLRYRDEIGVLTGHYNAMVDRLNEQDHQLRELYDAARATASYLEGYSNHLVEGVPSGVVAVDPQGRVSVCNPSAVKILGRSLPQGSQPGELLGSGHPLSRALEGALAGSLTFQALMVLDSDGDDGEQRLVELTCAPFHGAERQLAGAVALVTDRTELEQLRRSASRNERLAAIGNLGAGLAHEIKNPLGAISGFAELIERKEGRDAARLAGRLRGEVRELNEFLNEFLAFARENTIRREATDLNAVVRRAVELAVSAHEFSQLERETLDDGFRLSLPGDACVRVRLEPEELPELALDAALLRSALLNLVRNGIQAMQGSGGGELLVRTHRAGESVFVRVRDQGPGVRPEDREKIFDPLFTTRAEGTGLGLALANKTVTAHRGKLSLRDAPGGGAEFVIALPIVGTTSSEDATPDPACAVAD